jgi:hypothetical protein
LIATKDATMRIGPIFLIVGGAAGLIGGATHGDLPEDSGAAALQFVADHPAYAMVHLISILGAVLWALGLTGWRVNRSMEASQWLARAAGHVALIGAAVLAVQFSLDGIGMEALAALWSEPRASKGVFEAIAQIAPEALVGTALTWVVLLYGLTPILAGSSLILANHSTVGWSGLVIGAFSLVGGLLLALRVEIMPDWLVFAGSTIGGNLWIIALGVVMLRKAPAGIPQSSPQ